MPKRIQLDSRWLIWVGYVAYFGFCFVIFSYLMFPYDRLEEVAKQELAARTGDKNGAGAMKLEIGSISPYWPPGVTLNDVSIEQADEGGASKLDMKLDSVTARLRVLPLLLGKQSVGFSAEQGVGTLDGSVSLSETRNECDLEIDAIDAEAIGLGALLEIPIKGQISADAAITLAAIPTETDGDVTLTIENLQIGDGKAKFPVPGMRDGLTVERISAGTLTMVVEIRQGVAEIKSLSTDGPDLKLTGSGNIKLAEDLGRSRVDATVEVSFSEAYKTRNDRTKGLFQMIGFAPELKAAVTEGGGLRFRITGSLASPRGKAQGNARAGGPRSAKRPRSK